MVHIYNKLESKPPNQEQGTISLTKKRLELWNRKNWSFLLDSDGEKA